MTPRESKRAKIGKASTDLVWPVCQRIRCCYTFRSVEKTNCLRSDVGALNRQAPTPINLLLFTTCTLPKGERRGESKPRDFFSHSCKNDYTTRSLFLTNTYQYENTRDSPPNQSASPFSVLSSDLVFSRFIFALFLLGSFSFYSESGKRKFSSKTRRSTFEKLTILMKFVPPLPNDRSFSFRLSLVTAFTMIGISKIEFSQEVLAN